MQRNFSVPIFVSAPNRNQIEKNWLANAVKKSGQSRQCQVASLILIGRDVVPRRIDPVGVRFAQLHLDLNHNGFALMEFFTKSAALVMSHGCWFEIGVMKMIIVLPKQSKKLNFVRYEKPTAQN